MTTEINIIKHILDAAQSMMDDDFDSARESLRYATNELDDQTIR